jgi:integrase
LLTQQVAGCTEATLRCYSWWLARLLAEVPIPTPLAVRGFFARLQERGLSPSRQHQAYRTLRTFFRWCVVTGALAEDLLRGFTLRTPKTLPDVPTNDALRAVWLACLTHWRARGIVYPERLRGCGGSVRATRCL